MVITDNQYTQLFYITNSKLNFIETSYLLSHLSLNCHQFKMSHDTQCNFLSSVDITMFRKTSQNAPLQGQVKKHERELHSSSFSGQFLSSCLENKTRDQHLLYKSTDVMNSESTRRVQLSTHNSLC